MRLKVLPLSRWMKNPDHPAFPTLVNEPVDTELGHIGRDGYYLLGGIAWFEYDGIAYKYDAISFMYDMDLLNMPSSIREEDVEALHTLILNGLASDTNLKLYQLIQRGRELETIRISMKKHFIRTRNRLKQMRRVDE